MNSDELRSFVDFMFVNHFKGHGHSLDDAAFQARFLNKEVGELLYVAAKYPDGLFYIERKKDLNP